MARPNHPNPTITINRARHALAAIVTWCAGDGGTAGRAEVRRTEHSATATGPADLGLAMAQARDAAPARPAEVAAGRPHRRGRRTAARAQGRPRASSVRG
jgi:hypothetical protein